MSREQGTYTLVTRRARQPEDVNAASFIGNRQDGAWDVVVGVGIRVGIGVTQGVNVERGVFVGISVVVGVKVICGVIVGHGVNVGRGVFVGINVLVGCGLLSSPHRRRASASFAAQTVHV